MSGKTSPSVPHSKAPIAARTAPATTSAAGSLHPHAGTGAPAEDAIRTRAYSLWEEAGHPNCDGMEFWLKAEQELANSR
jgi:hypothetical protein